MNCRKVLAALALIILSNCGYGTNQTSRLQGESLIVRDQSNAWLGSGYNSLKGIHTGNRCLASGAMSLRPALPQSTASLPTPDQVLLQRDPLVVEIGYGTVNFDRNLSFSEAMSKLDIGLELKVRIHPLIQLRGEVNFVNDTAHSTLDETFSLTSRTVYRTDRISEPRLDQDLWQRVSTPPPSPTDQSRPFPTDLCGDEYVKEVDKGILVHATLAVHFQNRFDRLKWDGEIGVTLLEFINIPAVRISKENIDVAERTKVTLHVMQKGGNPEDLLKLIPDGGDVFTKTGMISCNLNHIQPCYDAYQKVIAYVARLNAEDESQSDELYPLEFRTQRYADVHFEPTGDADQEVFIQQLKNGSHVSQADRDTVERTRGLILEDIDQARDHLRIAEAVVAREASFIGSERHTMYRKMFQDLQDNLTSLLSAYQDCFISPAQCEQSYRNLNQVIKPVATAFLYTQPASFKDWCEDYKVETGNPEDLVTVRGILRYAARQFGVNTADCAETSRVLDEAYYIEVGEKEGITSLAPFTSFRNMIRLTVRDNAIKDIGPLVDMPQLQAIDLSKNLVEDLTPILWTQRNLKIVNLDENPRLTPPTKDLERDSPLQKLYLRWNAIENFSKFNALAENIYILGNPSNGEGCSHCELDYAKPFKFPSN